MAILTNSRFYYGWTVDANNFHMDIDEGGPEIETTIPTRSYFVDDLMSAVEGRLNADSVLNYVVSFNRDTRLVTISADSPFSLLVASGTNLGVDIYPLLGFTGADRTGANTYTGDSVSGLEYLTQFVPQNFRDRLDEVELFDPSVHQSVTGETEVIFFGDRNFFEFELKFITDLQGDCRIIRNNPTGVQDARDLLNDAILKRKLEFMPDLGDPSAFFKVIMESTATNRAGTGFVLREMYRQNIVGYFETGRLRFREVD